MCINENLPAMYFVGLGVDKKASDHANRIFFREIQVKRENLSFLSSALNNHYSNGKAILV